MSDWTVTEEKTILDRSTLEDWATCPARAALRLAQGHTRNRMMIVGSMAHEAISQTVRDWLLDGPEWAPGMFADSLVLNAKNARTDYRADVVQSVKYAAGTLGAYLARLSRSSIIAYDGGDEHRSGQYAHEIEVDGHPVVITSEVDLLHRGAADDEVHEVDYKTGWKMWTSEMVRSSFQFRLHAWLIMQAYPDVNTVTVRVIMTRVNDMTGRVKFERHKLAGIERDIEDAARQYLAHRERQSAPAYPDQDKCNLCDVAGLCASSEPLIVSEDPQGALREYIVLKARVDKLAKQLGAYADENGPIVSGKDCYGRFSTSKPQNKLSKIEEGET